MNKGSRIVTKGVYMYDLILNTLVLFLGIALLILIYKKSYTFEKKEK